MTGSIRSWYVVDVVGLGVDGLRQVVQCFMGKYVREKLGMVEISCEAGFEAQ
jgi:hypothetical protein